MVLQEAGDAERVTERIGFRGLLEDIEPLLVGLACLVGVGEYHHLVVHQRGKELGLKHLEAAAGHPDKILENFGENNSRLFGLNYTDGRWLMAEV